MVLVGGYTELYKTEANSVAAVCRMLCAANITPERRHMAAAGESLWVVYVCMFRSAALCIMNIGTTQRHLSSSTHRIVLGITHTVPQL